jgi:hypothetical protein
MMPFVSQLVLYHDGLAGQDVAAIVTAVHDGFVDLTLFRPGRGTESKPHVFEGVGLGQWSARESPPTRRTDAERM